MGWIHDDNVTMQKTSISKVYLFDQLINRDLNAGDGLKWAHSALHRRDPHCRGGGGTAGRHGRRCPYMLFSLYISSYRYVFNLIDLVYIYKVYSIFVESCQFMKIRLYDNVLTYVKLSFSGNLLKPMLGRGELRCIGATTLDEYRKYIEKDPALERRFQQVSHFSSVASI